MTEPRGEILTLDETPAYGKARKRTDYHLAAQGTPPAFKLGCTRLFHHSDLNEWIAANLFGKLLSPSTEVKSI